MKITSVFAGAAVLFLAACGHDNSGAGPTPPTSGTPPSTPPSTSINVTSSQILSNYAQQPSETAEPFAVNGGAFTITDTNDQTAPIPVSAN